MGHYITLMSNKKVSSKTFVNMNSLVECIFHNMGIMILTVFMNA